LIKKKILLAYGTRPEIIKLAPVLFELKKRKDVKLTIVNTGQHREMVIELEKLFGIIPDINFGIMSPNQSLNSVLSKICEKSSVLLNKIKPDIVVVQGDTTTVLAMGISAFYNGIKVAHVEAGLRSHEIKNPFPEEFNRRVITLFAEYNFVPTRSASDNLIREKVNKETIFVTGNTVVDALRLMLRKIKKVKKKGTKKIKKILITAHRRENHGKGIEAVCAAVKEILKKHKNVEFLWPVHPNPNVERMVYDLLGNTRGIKLSPPLPYLELISEIQDSFMIWTDSGGIQEEAPSMKKPVLILRTVTERPEVVDAGFGVLTGTDTAKIVSTTTQLLTDSKKYARMTTGKNPFGDGKASIRIARLLLKKQGN